MTVRQAPPSEIWCDRVQEDKSARGKPESSGGQDSTTVVVHWIFRLPGIVVPVVCCEHMTAMKAQHIARVSAELAD